MKQVVIVSGKGGTGKTSITACLANLAANDAAWHTPVLVDADVDAANLSLVISPEVHRQVPYSGGLTAVIDQEACISCGACESVCHFSAIRHENDRYQVDPFGCEGCTLCQRVCPAGAIIMIRQENGRWYQSGTRFGECFHADLYPGQGNSGKLVTVIRKQAEQWTRNQGQKLMLIDGPPGIGCPVMAAVTGIDLAVIVTEPSASGLHDLGRILQTLYHFRVPSLVVVNKSGMNGEAESRLATFCQQERLPIVGRIPFTHQFVNAMINQQTLLEHEPDGTAADALRLIWNVIKQTLDKD
ncbi:MAG: 4Fe-4S binding protein [Anaerolineae bacterium]|nr:4Fe-4S binding protein [Anaerolineae bacterium]